MRISDLLSPADVMIDVRAPNKRLLLQELATKTANSLGLDTDQVAPYLLKREELGSTAYGQKIETAQRRQRSNIFGLGPVLHNKLAVDA